MIHISVEGESDREAAKAVVRSAGRTVATVVVAGGKTRLDPKIPKYNEASRRANWIVFRDSDGQCPLILMRHLTAKIGVRNSRFLLRIAHSMTEAWLLADRDGFSDFFHVSPGQLPSDPESLTHAKQTLLALCSKSRSRALRGDLVTRDGQTGPLYVSRINEFASTRWSVAAASANSPSLSRAIRSIRTLP
jgi:hypothetical protein